LTGININSLTDLKSVGLSVLGCVPQLMKLKSRNRNTNLNLNTMENETKINLNLQDLLILKSGLEKYLKAYPETANTNRVNDILDNAFKRIMYAKNKIINTKNK
jgi:hypothetical protein